MTPTLFTIGHSTHAIEAFLALLQQHGITALADVRSAPYSRRNPQFNRETLEAALAACGIRYVYLGKELGGRKEGRDKPGPTAAGPTSVDPAGAAEFDSGITRLLRGMQDHTIAIMCAEKDPADCHRTHLVTPALVARGVDVRHILADGTLLQHANAAPTPGSPGGALQSDLFESR